MNNIKLKLRHITRSLPILTLIVLLTSCHSTKYFAGNNIVIETTPGAALLWKDGKFDGGFLVTNAGFLKSGNAIRTANDKGIAVFSLSKSAYHRNKLKKIMIAKEGFEPQELKLATKFNSRVLWSILFPPAFIWGKYTTLNPKGENKLLLSQKSKYTANEYWEAANSAKKNREKIELLKQALYQDPLNAQGIGIQVANQLCDIYFDKKDYDRANQYATAMLLMNPHHDKGREKAEQIRLALAEKAAKKARRLERIQKTNKALQAFNTALTASNSATMSSNSGANYNQHTDSSIQKSSSKSRKKVSVSDAQNEMRDRRTYSNYMDQLSRMKTGLDQYNDTNRRNIQEKMRQLRTKHGFPKNELEDWDGSK